VNLLNFEAVSKCTPPVTALHSWSCLSFWRAGIRGMNHFFWLGFSFLAVLEFELKTSHLLGRSCTAWGTLPAFFALVILETGSLFFAQADLCWDSPNFMLLLSLGWGVTGTCHHTQLFSVEMGGLQNFFFCQGWPWTVMLPISVSQLAEITRLVNHCSWLGFFFFKSTLLWSDLHSKKCTHFRYKWFGT
jgi:hypothetical protein